MSREPEPWCWDYPACRGGLQDGEICLDCDAATVAYNAWADASNARLQRPASEVGL